MRILILLHRYLGIGVGLVMAMWCASGFVMMYVGFPTLDEQQRLKTLESIDWHACCAYDAIASALGVNVIGDFSVEMVAGRPVLRAAMAAGSRQVFDLKTGARVTSFDTNQAATVAGRFAEVDASEFKTRSNEQVIRDQWTVQGQFNSQRPLHRITLADQRGTVLYVSSSTGEVVQETNAQQRFWNWLGAVPHWLYPTVLRQHGALWTQVVIWLSLAGAFLTAIGLYIGVARWRAALSNRWSPYRGVKLWHHLSGLIFGVLLLTWVMSGWVSMNPWGLFAGEGANTERDSARDVWIDGRLLTTTLRSIANNAAARGVTRIESAPLNGQLYLLAYRATKTERLDATTLAPTPLQVADIATAVKSFSSEKAEPQIDLLTKGDNYYYSGHEPRSFPIYRFIRNDSERTRYYFDPNTGDMVGKITAPDRWYRWAFEGLHRWDFSEGLRQRPVWDLLVLTLLLGVTVVSFTGVYMAYRYLLPKSRQ